MKEKSVAWVSDLTRIYANKQTHTRVSCYYARCPTISPLHCLLAHIHNNNYISALMTLTVENMLSIKQSNDNSFGINKPVAMASHVHVCYATLRIFEAMKWMIY